MKIYRNLWAGYEMYFVKIGSSWSGKHDPTTKVLNVFEIEGIWNIDFGKFYTRDLRDAEHFPYVGDVDLKRVIIDAVLDGVAERKKHE